MRVGRKERRERWRAARPPIKHPSLQPGARPAQATTYPARSGRLWPVGPKGVRPYVVEQRSPWRESVRNAPPARPLTARAAHSIWVAAKLDASFPTRPPLSRLTMSRCARPIRRCGRRIGERCLVSRDKSSRTCNFLRAKARHLSRFLTQAQPVPEPRP